MSDLGLSFMPNAQPNQPGQGPQPGVEPVQNAIRILSLRLPKVVGGGAFAPGALLNGAGAQGNPFTQTAFAQTQKLGSDPLGGLGNLPGPSGSGPSVTGAPSPGLDAGSIPPGMLQQLLDLLAGRSGGNTGGNTPTPSRIIPGGESRNPNPIPSPGPTDPTMTPPPLDFNPGSPMPSAPPAPPTYGRNPLGDRNVF